MTERRIPMLPYDPVLSRRFAREARRLVRSFAGTRRYGRFERDSVERFAGDREAYAAGKTAFIRETEALARSWRSRSQPARATVGSGKVGDGSGG